MDTDGHVMRRLAEAAEGRRGRGHGPEQRALAWHLAMAGLVPRVHGPGVRTASCAPYWQAGPSGVSPVGRGMVASVWDQTAAAFGVALWSTDPWVGLEDLL
jgi:hypothetical protein